MTKEIRHISLLAIRPDPTQPRKDFDDEELWELAQSIGQNGLLNPIIVKTNGDGEYIIIAGERRYRAHQILDAETIECIVYNGSNGKELQLVENINRKDLNYMELALAYRSYLDSGHTLDELSEVVGKPKNIISWMLNLEKCRPDVQHLVRRNQLSLVIAISLSKLTENGQLRALRTMQTTKLNVAECQALCEQIYSEENQADMFTEEPKLTSEEMKARAKIQSALDRTCQALQEVNKMEADNPGISAQAIAEKLDITQEKVDLLYNLVGQFKKNLRQKRVAALC
ncbi:ParB/RepB/Spo0J family partition protein [Chloroflexota bacterium]